MLFDLNFVECVCVCMQDRVRKFTILRKDFSIVSGEIGTYAPQCSLRSLSMQIARSAMSTLLATVHTVPCSTVSLRLLVLAVQSVSSLVSVFCQQSGVSVLSVVWCQCSVSSLVSVFCQQSGVSVLSAVSSLVSVLCQQSGVSVLSAVWCQCSVSSLVSVFCQQSGVSGVCSVQVKP